MSVFLDEENDILNPIYLDQAVMRKNIIMGRRFTSCYTPFGIQKIETDFCNRIMAASTKAQFDSLRYEVIKNPHLHDEIKDNLLLNIDSRCKK